MSIVAALQPKDDPSAPLINITREHVKEFRRILRSNFAEHGGDVSTLNRRNGFFIEGKEAVEILDKASFDYGRNLDATERYWFAVFCARALRRLRGNPKHTPKFIEVF
jgi:hypothetical protein